jgi:hypothetical protein
MAASDDPASAEGSAAGDDDFGVRLSWPEEVPGSTHRRRPVRRLDEQRGASASSAGGAPVLPELAARIEKLQSLVRSVLTRVDAHQNSSLAAIEALSARLDEQPAPAGVDSDAIGSLEGGIDSLASDIAELRTEVAQLKRRGAVSSQPNADVAQLAGEIAALNTELGHLKRRLPVRAKADTDTALVDTIIAAVHERLGSDLGAQIADIVVNRLFDVVEVVEIDDSLPPTPPPSPTPEKRDRPVAAKRRPGRRPTGRR